MKILEKYMPLNEGEQVLDSIEGNAYNTSANIFLRVLGSIIKIIAIILGISRKVTLVVTDQRIISVEISKILWVIDGSVISRSYTPRSINQIGYSLARSLIIFKSHYFEFVSSNSGYLIKAQGGQEKVMEIIKSVNNLSETIKSA